MNIAGVVVLYNQSILELIKNISTYIDELDILYVFDNSDVTVINENDIINFSNKIVYISHGENKGIAFALN